MKTLFKLFIGTHVALFRLTGGRLGSKMGGGKVLLLTTTGNKSGKKRTVPVMQLDEDGRRFVIASAAGSKEHPAWFKNLRAHPEVTVEVRGQRYDARAEPLSSEERAKIWPKLIARAPNFAEYEKKAEGREIPVVELKPI
ncbi:MAG TPA: nitroreductase family deazaflavin-dependent oxidoreductase [Polyangia bacterium]